MRKSQEWATRLMLEAKDYQYNYFLTLTYDPLHLPVDSIIDKDTGQVVEIPNLHKEHLIKFIKAVRQYYKQHYNIDNIRFFASGEYGDTTCRPHYHIIMLNFPIYDLKIFKRGHNPLYRSNILESIWKKGGIMIAECSWETCAYTARYVMKKTTKEHTDKYLNLQQEFVNMSRVPGIGKKYFEEHKDDYINYGIVSSSSSHVARSIQYFDKLYSDIDSFKLAKVKDLRKNLAINSQNIQLSNTDLDEYNYNKVKHNYKKNSVKALIKYKI